jgi:hypothetical protein
MTKDTLAYRLGTTAHVSPLLMKARRLGLRVPEDLCELAVQRGCRYYAGGGDLTAVVRESSPAPMIAVPETASFSNEELALALQPVLEGRAGTEGKDGSTAALVAFLKG